ncbi:hypothetical protein KIK06_08085 [Nocardiopsis sp. EMB25]|uniref:hypothetical protein n=1 Tax=Nocardiopsis TaxID=2013 RepID=UPI00034A62F5|nr:MULTISPECIES: hypothetical protein [Nocardiopsis]MCY9783848.1 hypothetical protein [Nocardiopsis sp. EMB25]
MGVPTQGLHEGDPRQLGGFRLVGRTRASSLGVVYLGRDASGAEVSVVVLNAGASGDPQARERFARSVRGRGDVLAARTRGRSVLWVAVPADTDGPGAEAVLEETARGGPVGDGGPVVQPYWAGERRGSVVLWAPWRARRDSAIGAGAASLWLAVALGVLLLVLMLGGTSLIGWLSTFPPPEIPQPGQEVEVDPEESEPAGEPTPAEEGEEQAPEPRPGEGEPEVPEPTVPGDLEGDPEGHL